MTDADVDVVLADLVGSSASPQALIFAALARAQAAFPPIPKSRTIQIRAGREYSYAPLEAILGAVRRALAAEHLAVTQTFNGDTLVTSLLHSAGGMIESVMPVPRGDLDWQSWGSAITYARRYALTAILGVAPEDDDDATQAVQAPEKKPAKTPRMVTNPQQKKMHASVRELDEAGMMIPPGFPGAESWVDVTRQRLRDMYGVESSTELTAAQASELIDWLEEQQIPFG
jgi:hypothetical protein